MIITRNGKQIELTENELRLAWEELEQRRVRSVVESEVEEQGYKFDNYEDFCYESEQDFREDFIEKCIEDMQDAVDEECGVYDSFVKGIVEGNAEGFDLEPEF